MAADDQVRRRRLTGRDGGCRQRHAERGDQDLALAEPVLSAFDEVHRGRHRTGHRGQALDDEVSADTVLGGRVRQRTRGHSAGQFGECGVTGIGEGLGHRDRTQVELVVVRDGAIADIDLAGTAQKGVGRGHFALDRRSGGDDLEG